MNIVSHQMFDNKKINYNFIGAENFWQIIHAILYMRV